MASPESSRIGGARPSGGGGVKGLLAMFENSGSASPAGGNASRDITPGPKPLSKVRTSFVAVTGSNGQMMGLQRISTPPSPVVTTDGGKFTPNFQDKDKVVQDKSVKKEEGIDPVNGAPKVEEPKKLETKADLKGDIKREIKAEPRESVNGFSRRSPAVPAPVPEKIQIKKEDEAPQKPLETIVTKAEEEKKDTKPTKTDDSKPRPAAIKTGHPPKSPMKSGFNSPRLNRSSVKSPAAPGNTLTLPTSRTTTASPLPSPTIPRSPARGAPTTGSANSRRPTSTSRASSKTRSTTTSSTSNTPTNPTFNTSSNNATLSTAPKTRQSATSKAKTAAPPKTEQKPIQSREPTRPAAMRGSAFGPTAASAAKLSADQAKQPIARRPPSSASAIRRPESNLGTRATARKATKSPVRPATSAATRSSRTSTGSATSVAPVGGDFLSRMMRPTTASASKVTDKKQIPTHQPSKRSGSVASSSRRKEASSLPPPKVRLQKEDTQSEGSATEESVTRNPTKAEGQVRADVEASTMAAPEIAAPKPKQTTEVVEEPKSSANELSVDTAAKEITNTNTQDSSVAGNDEDEGHTPTTTASSTTLVHEGDAQEEVTAKEE